MEPRSAEELGGAGLAEVFQLHRRRGARDVLSERDYFFDTLAEYQWARDAAGLMPETVDKLVKPVIEICEYLDLAPWRLQPRDLDRYFAGPGKRARSTVRTKINTIDGYFAFLEQRYAGEISRRFGVAVESPIDPFNRPRHRGDFGLRCRLLDDWLLQRHDQWPASPNPHLLVTTHSAHHPALPPVSYCALRRAFDRTGITPRQMWSDRVLDEARQTADPVHLVHLFGIHPGTAVRYVHTAHPDKALPPIR
ncbi:hypothetical protein ACIRPZ_23180 [Streptomyces anulatus]